MELSGGTPDLDALAKSIANLARSRSPDGSPAYTERQIHDLFLMVFVVSGHTDPGTLPSPLRGRLLEICGELERRGVEDPEAIARVAKEILDIPPGLLESFSSVLATHTDRASSHAAGVTRALIGREEVKSKAEPLPPESRRSVVTVRSADLPENSKKPRKPRKI